MGVGASLCEHIDYGGLCQNVGTGKHNVDVLKIPGGVGNDKISSIQLSPGHCIKVYEHKDFGGKAGEFCQSVSNLKDHGWNDQISSIEVYSTAPSSGASPPPPPPPVTAPSGDILPPLPSGATSPPPPPTAAAAGVWIFLIIFILLIIAAIIGVVIY